MAEKGTETKVGGKGAFGSVDGAPPTISRGMRPDRGGAMPSSPSQVFAKRRQNHVCHRKRLAEQSKKGGRNGETYAGGCVDITERHFGKMLRRPRRSAGCIEINGKKGTVTRVLVGSMPKSRLSDWLEALR